MDNHGVARSARRQLTEAEKKRELKRIEKYQELVRTVQANRLAEDYSSTALSLTTALLTQNPEFYSIWNYRRLILTHAFNSPPADDSPSPDPGLTPSQHELTLLLAEDLGLVTQLQRPNPKVYWLWNHRAWLLAQATLHLPPAYAGKFWQNELLLVTKMLSLDGRNFHGWQYRQAVIAALESLPGAERAALAEAEFGYADQLVRSDFSNFSAWHHRMLFLRKKLSTATEEEKRAAYDAELGLASELLWLATDERDQSTWMYHADLVAMLDPKEDEKWALARIDEAERREIVEAQMDGVKEILEDNEGCKWIYQSLLGLAEVLSRLGGTTAKSDVDAWLSKLEELDPLRRGRWTDWRAKLGL